MASLLETQMRKSIAQGFSGKLLKGQLRRVTTTAVDAKGDASSQTVKTYTFDGFVDTFNAAFAAAAGIVQTDVRILIIAGSLAVEPVVDDQVKIRNEWFQLRRLVTRDPALAHYQFAGFKVAEP